ncbi:MAG: hypothetical protein IIA44_07835, partial [Acidobacteria bacterium]|nr:hypothetical protein [Acidobacteriota bacterium]
PAGGEFCGASRVETVHYMPLAPGTFQFRAFGESGTVEFELSKGPLDTSGGGGGPLPNIPPVAAAGVDQTVSDNDSTGSELVGLDGSASSDADGTIASYDWSEGGVTIATGVTPTVDLALGVHTITLTVTDDDGDSGSDTVVVTVKAANQDPVADAGPDQIVSDFAGDGIEPVGLDGSASSDPDGTIASYDWSEGGVTIATGATPTVNLGVGVHTITLAVTDNEGAGASDTVIVTVEAGNQFPVADAGVDQTVSDADADGAEAVSLDGSLSSDPDGTIASYDWSEGGTTIATGATPTVSLGVGVHTITLTVTDNDGDSGTDTVVVTVGAGPLVAGPEFRVNDDITFNQGSPNVAVLNDGNFVIAYAGNNADANMHGVVARLYDPAGNPLTDEFIVNTGVVDDQYEPSVSALDDGGFVVTWTSNLQDGSEVGIYGQRFDAVGNPVGTEFRVNTMTQRSQSSSEAAMLTGGGFVVTWNSWRQDGNKLGIYAQRYIDTTPPIVAAVSSQSGEPILEGQDAMSEITSLVIQFSKNMSTTGGAGGANSVTNPANYSIDLGITVSAATLDSDLRTVTLTTSNHSAGVSYTLTVNGMLDRATTPNPIAPNTQVSYLAKDPSLVAHWTFDEGSGSTVLDSSGNGSTGTLQNLDPVSSWIPGQFSTALQFDGVNDYVAFGNPVALQIGANITISAWIKPEATPTGQNARVISKDNGSTGDNWTLAIGDNFAVDCRIGNTLNESPGGVIATSVWRHVACTYDGATVRVYVAGVEKHSYSHSGDIPTSGNVVIGRNDGSPGRFFSGGIDDVRTVFGIQFIRDTAPQTGPVLDEQGQPTTRTETRKKTIFDRPRVDLIEPENVRIDRAAELMPQDNMVALGPAVKPLARYLAKAPTEDPHRRLQGRHGKSVAPRRRVRAKVLVRRREPSNHVRKRRIRQLAARGLSDVQVLHTRHKLPPPFRIDRRFYRVLVQTAIPIQQHTDSLLCDRIFTRKIAQKRRQRPGR